MSLADFACLIITVRTDHYEVVEADAEAVHEYAFDEEDVNNCKELEFLELLLLTVVVDVHDRKQQEKLEYGSEDHSLFLLNTIWYWLREQNHSVYHLRHCCNEHVP